MTNADELKRYAQACARMSPDELKLHNENIKKNLNEIMLRLKAKMRFRSYFWDNQKMPDVELRRALLKIISTSSTEKKLEAFQKLLSSDLAIAQGVAFDQFAYAEVQTNRGAENPFLPFSEQVLSKARAQLQTPPVTAVNLEQQTIVGANHASALAVLKFIAQEEDIPSIEQILRSAKDANVLYEACWALEHCLQQSNNPHQEIVEILKVIIFDEDAHPRVREQAISVFLDYYLREAEPMLVQATQQCPVGVAARAAWVLGIWNFEKYRSLLEKLFQGWGEQEDNYNVRQVRELLTDNSVEESSTITEQPDNSVEAQNEPLTAQRLEELFESSHLQLQKSAWCEQVNSQYGHFRQGTNTGFTIPKRREAIEDVYDHFFPNAVIGFEPEELQQWLSSGYQSHPNYGIAALQAKTISNLRKPDAQDTDTIIALATQDASVVEQFFCELLGIKKEVF